MPSRPFSQLLVRRSDRRGSWGVELTAYGTSLRETSNRPLRIPSSALKYRVPLLATLLLEGFTQHLSKTLSISQQLYVYLHCMMSCINAPGDEEPGVNHNNETVQTQRFWTVPGDRGAQSVVPNPHPLPGWRHLLKRRSLLTLSC